MKTYKLEKVIKGLRCLSNPYIQDMDERDCENCQYDNACCFLDVTADALSLLKASVSQGVFDQVKWERDTAIAQLEEIGKGLGAKMDDVKEVLKVQEPKVMTLEEVKQAKGRDVWLELSGNIAEDVITAATIEGCGTGGICTRYKSLNYAQYCMKPYGWRCWTSRPSDSEKENTPWEN